MTRYMASIVDPDTQVVIESMGFERTREAWEWLATERREEEDEAEMGGYTETVDDLDAKAAASAGIGEVIGSTPGYSGTGGDTGFVYSVSVTQEGS